MMSDLEALRSIFQDIKQHIAIGVITKIALAKDNTKLRVQVSLLPEQREIVAIMGWEDVGLNAGYISFPELNDLVLVAFVDGHPDDAFVIKRFTTSEEPIPLYARSGHTVAYAHPGKKMYVGSDTKVGIARPGKEPAQPLVLGTVLVSALQALINAFLNAAQVGQGALGPVFLDPAVRTALTTFNTTYLTTTSTNILSQLGYTERGTE